MPTRNRAWCFTVNNYSDDDEQKLQNFPCRYIVYGHEVGEQGTPHLQGYLYLTAAKTLRALKKDMPDGAHLEVAKGNADQNFEYCTKQDEGFFEMGDRPVSQKRKGELGAEYWENVRKRAKEGDLDEIDAEVYVKHYSTLRRIQKDHVTMPDDAPDVTGVWYWGEAGVGKSRAARHDFPGAYFKMANKWWDGYRDEKFVLLDDLDPRHKVLGHHLKIWADRYSFLAENKGGAVAIRPEKIIVTSQYSPEQIWDDEPETVAAIRRRFKVKHFDQRWQPPPPPLDGGLEDFEIDLGLLADADLGNEVAGDMLDLNNIFDMTQ